MSEVHHSATLEKRPNFHRRLGGSVLSVATLLILEGSSTPVVPNLPEDTKVVAVGDSYTSGHANGDVKERFEECFRDDISYANYIARQLGIDNFTNVACSGAHLEKSLKDGLTSHRKLTR